jgi:tetratricopeptide (TPR) repeat protein
LVEAARNLPVLRLEIGADPVHESLVKERNENAHGAPWNESECVRRLPVLKRLIDKTLNLFRPLVDLELLRKSPGGMIRLVGSKESFAPEPLPEDGPLQDSFEESDLVVRGPDGALLPLYPLFLPPDGLPEGYAEVLLLAGHGQKSVVYIGTRRRTERQDTLARYLDLLRAKNIDPRFTLETMTPWSVSDWARATSLGAVENLKGVKYFPNFYKERRTRQAPIAVDLEPPPEHAALDDDDDEPDGGTGGDDVGKKRADGAAPGERGVDDIVWRWIEKGKEAALLVAADAGNGKTSLFCRLTERLSGQSAATASEAVGEPSQDCVLLLLAGEKMRDGLNRLFRRMRDGLGFSDDPVYGVHGFDHLLAAWEEAGRKQDAQNGERRLVILLDAVNEAQNPKGLLEEAAELASQAAVANTRAGRPWVRILLSVRTHVVEALLDHWGAQNDAPFLASPHNFAHFDDGRHRHTPYLALRPFALDEAGVAFERARACLPDACASPWADLPPATQDLLRRPLMVLLFHQAFSGQACPPAPATASTLWSAWLDRTFQSASALEKRALDLADACIDAGANRVPDELVAAWRKAWQQDEMANDPVRIAASLDPFERLAAVGLLRQVDRGGWDWVSDSLAGQVYFRALRRQDPNLSEESLTCWLDLPATPRLSGALVEAAATCWRSGSPLALRALLGARMEDADRLISQTLLDVAPRGPEVEISRKVESFAQALAQLAAWCQAEGRQMQCEHLARPLLWNVQDGLRDRRGTTPALRKVAETATELAEVLAHSNQGDVFRLRDLSAAYDRIGDLDARSAPAKARVWYEKALGVREKLVALEPSNPGFQSDLAHTYADLSAVDARRDRTKAKEWMGKALRIAEKLVAGKPEDPMFLRALAVSYHTMGQLDESHSPDKAKTCYARALEIRQKLVAVESNDTALVLDLAATHHRLGLLEDPRDRVKAERSFEKALEITENLVEREPESTAVLRAHALSCDRIGTLYKVGDPAKARLWRDRSLEIRERLVALEPSNTAFLRDLSVSYSQMGGLEERSDPAKARAWFEKDLGIAERLAEQEPDNTTFLLDLSISYRQMAEVDDGCGPDRARVWLSKAVSIREQLVAREPDNSMFLSSLADSYTILGRLERRADPNRARPWFEKAVDLREQLVAREPNSTAFLKSLTHSYTRLGRLERRADPDKARPWFKKAADSREQLVAREPNNTAFLSSLARSYSRMGRLERHIDPDKAKAWFEKSLHIRTDLVTREPENQTFLSQLAFSYETMGGVDERGDQRDVSAWLKKALGIRESLAARAPNDPKAFYNLACTYALMRQLDDAISNLSLSVDRGYADSDQAADDCDLNSLHDRPDFQALLVRMRENAGKNQALEKPGTGVSLT